MLELLTTKRIETYFGRSQRSVALGDFRYLKTVVLASFSWQNTCIIHSLPYWWTPITPLQSTCALTCCVISLASRFPQPFPSPSKKRSHEIKKKYPAERARFSRRGKGVGKWIISDQKQLYFEGRSRHLLAQLSRCYKKIKGGFFCHLKSVSGSKKKSVLFSLWFLIRFLNRLTALKKSVRKKEAKNSKAMQQTPLQLWYSIIHFLHSWGFRQDFCGRLYPVQQPVNKMYFLQRLLRTWAPVWLK